MRNINAELADHLQDYADFIKTRASVNYPEKMDVPIVWDSYFDSSSPVGAGTAGETGGQAALGLTDDLNLLELVNDRLKIQARRYPRPITNEMPDFG